LTYSRRWAYDDRMMAHAPDSPTFRAGVRLRALRRARKIPLVEVSRRAGMDVSLIAKVERGEVETTLERYERLADAVGTTLAYLFRRRAA